jgi:hypothetical protein
MGGIPITKSLTIFFELFAILIIPALRFFLLWLEEEHPEWNRNERFQRIIRRVPWWVGTIVIGSVLACFQDLVEFGARSGPMVARIMFGTMFILILSIGLFTLKIKALISYACVEIGVSLAAAAYTMSTLKDVIEPLQAVVLLTASYFMVRGLDNLRAGFQRRAEGKEAETKWRSEFSEPSQEI